MALPLLAPFPPAEIRAGMMPEEWNTCLESWLTLTKLYLQLPAAKFVTSSRDVSLLGFLDSYVRETSQIHHSDDRLEAPTSRLLRRNCFLLFHRLLSEVDPPPAPLLDWTSLADLSALYGKSDALKKLMDGLWARRGAELDSVFSKLKSSLVQGLERDDGTSDLEDTLRRLCPLLRASHGTGNFFMIGSDFLDALSSGYASACVSLRKRMVAVAYLGLMSLIDGEKANLSLLFDHVYILKSDAEANIIAQPALLPDLAMSTPIVDQLKDRVNAGDARAKPLFAYLETFPAKPRHPSKKKLDKKKADEVHGDAGEVHVHRMSLVSQVQDLFPDLGARFIVRLLDEYGDNVEELTAHLLEDSFPTHLKEADRGEKFAPIPKYTPYIPHTRRNIHDDDPLATLSVPSSSVHRGRRDGSLTADALLQSAPSAPQKAAILSALAAFDPADDEHDDTYDADDDNVDGTVDATSAGQDADVNDEALFHTYARSPGVFERDAATRRSQGRNTLKAETGMTDEAIEGWAVMILRDPRRLSRLEARFSTFTGAQRELSGSAWREGDETADRGRGRGKGRGGRGRGRGRGDAAGPAGGRDTQIARQRKETGKGGRANHNRREGRAKKMARGGFGPS